ncbi:MAG: copper ion binding protein, partial [Anaerolineae bacterium]
MASTKQLSLPIHGMTCASCVGHVERALRKVEGVASASVNLATERATVEYDPTRTGPAGLALAVHDAGYTAVTERATIPVGGMTCASCVGHVERALRKVEGVTGASVNLATERATVEFFPTQTGLADLRRAIEDAGYQALAVEEETVEDREREARTREMRLLKRKLVFAALISVPVFLGGYPAWFPWVPGFLQNWGVLFLLTTPVQFWAGWQFYRGAWAALKHKTSDMNTLIAIGTSAAYLYSAAATFAPQFFPG